MTYKTNNIVSLWVIGGREKINFICHNQNYLPYIKGEADLVYKKGKFYLFQTIDVPDEKIDDIEEFIGVDFGFNDIVVTSDGVKHSADGLNKHREHRQKVRSSIQAKADTSKRSSKRNCRKLLKRLSGRERTHTQIINHTIAKSIIFYAKENGKGVAIEDLTNIRFTSKRRNKKFRTKINKWSFAQLRSYLVYKGLLYGVPVIIVNPRYTSQTCNVCKHIGERTNKHFKCKKCGNNMDADLNAAINIATLGRVVNHVEESNNMSCTIEHYYSGLKPNHL
jgi:IS605 OrfB family transposase